MYEFLYEIKFQGYDVTKQFDREDVELEKDNKSMYIL